MLVAEIPAHLRAALEAEMKACGSHSTSPSPPSSRVVSSANRDQTNRLDAKTTARSHCESPLPRPSPTPTMDQLIADIDPDLGIQTRAKLDEDALADYADAMRNGVQFPPVIVFTDGTKLYLVDGFHRFEAARRAGCATINADVKRGSRHEAVRFALQANLRHGIRRTNADKRRAVEIAFQEFAGESDRAIVELCAVGNALVGEVRRQVCDSNNCQLRRGRDGKSYPPGRSPDQGGSGEPFPTAKGSAESEANQPAAASAMPSEVEADSPPGEHRALPTGGETTEGTAPPAIDTPVLAAGTAFRLADGREIIATIAAEGEFIPASKAQQVLRVIAEVKTEKASPTLIARKQHFILAIIQAVNEHAHVYASLTPRQLLLDLNWAIGFLHKLVRWQR